MQTEPRLKKLLRSQEHEIILLGCSGVSVYYLPKLSAYLKVAEVRKHSNIGWERKALEWLSGKLPVPSVLDFEHDDNKEYLLISEIPGVPASNFVASATVETMGKFIADSGRSMRLMHQIPTTDCALDQRLDAKLAKAKENIQAGLVDESDFDEDCAGKTALQIYDELCSERPDGEDLVFTHGDFTLPNIIVNKGAIAGFIDFERAGVADRYQDISLFLRSFSFNSDVEVNCEQIFCSAYGLSEIVYVKLNFYRKLDELF